MERAWAEDVAAHCASERARLRALSAPGPIGLALLFEATADLAVLRWLLGAERSEVRSLVGEACDAAERLLLDRDGATPLDPVRAAAGERDHTLASPRRAARALRLALAVDLSEHARRLAALALDPALADDGAAATGLGRALAAVVLGDRARARAALDRLADDLTTAEALEAAALAALVRGDQLGLRFALDRLAAVERDLTASTDATLPDRWLGLAGRALARAAAPPAPPSA